ncbi:MAG TPA: HNH endonuclease [Gallionellaceae bacterium]|nr:HNH endonuclease [Gallionellaceae bacterium]
MTKSRNILPLRTYWTEQQIELLRQYYPDKRTADLVQIIGRDEKSIYSKAKNLGLKKSAAFLATPASGRTNGRQGIGTRFVKGQQSWNKGTSYQPGGRCKETQFKKGHKHNTELPLGSLRINKDGYLERKTSMTHPVPARRWVASHRLVWIEAHGDVPAGHIVVFKPGMCTANEEEITLDKVELISRGENMKRNTYHRYPKEIATLIQLRGAVQRKINRRLKHERSDTTAA